MRYRVCKSFTVESGHLLSKHPGACRFPHGHTRRVDVVLSSETLDERDMVCDFKAIKLAVEAFIERFDHAMAVNSDDPRLENLKAASGDRVIVFEGEEPPWPSDPLIRNVAQNLSEQKLEDAIVLIAEELRRRAKK